MCSLREVACANARNCNMRTVTRTVCIKCPAQLIAVYSNACRHIRKVRSGGLKLLYGLRKTEVADGCVAKPVSYTVGNGKSFLGKCQGVKLTTRLI